MLRHHKLKNSNRLWRLVHTVTVVFVFSYIAFDVLDLDLSDFPLKQVARERVVVVTESPKGTELANLLDHDGLRMKPSLLDPSIFKESIRLQQKDKLIALFPCGSYSCAKVSSPSVFYPRLVSRCLKLLSVSSYPTSAEF